MISKCGFNGLKQGAYDFKVVKRRINCPMVSKQGVIDFIVGRR